MEASAVGLVRTGFGGGASPSSVSPIAKTSRNGWAATGGAAPSSRASPEWRSNSESLIRTALASPSRRSRAISSRRRSRSSGMAVAPIRWMAKYAMPHSGEFSPISPT